jgi:hypothetical protein
VAELLLHHFDLSPFAEKVRLMFGIKRLAWKSVEIPMIMPKPDLTALTGGYRQGLSHCGAAGGGPVEFHELRTAPVVRHHRQFPVRLGLPSASLESAMADRAAARAAARRPNERLVRCLTQT